MQGASTFLVSIIIAVGLAFVFPQAGASGGWLHSEITTKVGVFMIFLLQGLALPMDAIKRGFLQWQLHIFCQSTIFIWIPLLFLIMTWLLGNWLLPDLIVGFLYLAILPTTLSTAVAFTSQAGGNTVGSLFNASASNILGIFFVPVMATFISSHVGPALLLLPLLNKITVLLFLPLLIGQLFRVCIKFSIDVKNKHLGQINNYIICFILYTSFCNAVENDLLQTQGVGNLLLILALTSIMLLIITGSVFLAVRMLKFDYATSISALFCASQKLTRALHVLDCHFY